MKTPREILLCRHKVAEPKLDEIRCRALAESFGSRQEVERHTAFGPEPQIPKAVSSLRFATAVQVIWHELIWSCRWTWAGLATVWLAMLVFNHSQTQNHAVVAKSTTRPGEMRVALQEQRRVLEEIIGPALRAAISEPPRRPNNQPRSLLRTVGTA